MMRPPSRHAQRLARQMLCAALCGLSLGCMLDLDPVPSCGDGFVDKTAGENCDPSADDTAPCDPTTCQPLPVLCGNGKIDSGEACDTVDFANKECPTGAGFLTCSAACTLDLSTCDLCGNGVVDPGEECDPKLPKTDGFANPIECASLTTFPFKPYTTGVVTQCAPTCTWFRGPCGYCGDNETDPPTRVDLNYPDEKSEDEFCDGQDAPRDHISNYCEANCPGEVSNCKPQCLDDCSDFSQISADKLECCVARNLDCPPDGNAVPCCYAYDQGLSDLFDPDACFSQIDKGGGFKSVCK